MRILNWKAYHDDATSIVTLKIYSFCDLSSCDSKKDTSSANIACLTILFETILCFSRIFLFNIHIFVFNKFVNDTRLFPMFENMLHVDIGGEKAEDTVRDYLTKTSKQVAISDRDFNVITRNIFRAEILLIVSLTKDDGTDRITSDLYVNRLTDNWCKT